MTNRIEVDFKKFTRESIKAINDRILNEKMQQEIETDESIKEVSRKKYFEKEKSITCLNREANKDLDIGKKLPRGLKNLFPRSLFGIPIEEIDEFYKNDYIFTVIGNNYQIYRFNAKKSLFVLGPFNPIRRLSIFILTHSYPF